MSSKDLFDDHMEYKLSGGEDDDNKPTSNSGCLPWIIGVLVVLWIISKLFG